MASSESNGKGAGGYAVYAMLALGMATFGSATPVSKIVSAEAPVFVGSALRVGIGALALAPFVIGRFGEIRKLRRGDWAVIGLIALLGMFGFTALMLYGMQMVSGVVGAIVMSTAPAVTAAASMLLMGDRATWRKITAIALAVGGVLVLHLGRMGSGGGNGEEGGAGALLLGSALVFGAVCCEAAYTLLGKKISSRVDPVLAALLAAAVSLPLFVPLAVWQWGGFEPAGVSARAWMALVWYGAGTLALGTWLWYSGVRRAEGSVAAGFMGVMPASALILSYALLGEAFEWLHLVGFAIVFAGVLLVSWEHARQG
ncbi:MAG: DMT family transporter [Phycisphaerales bacterium JB039]